MGRTFWGHVLTKEGVYSGEGQPRFVLWETEKFSDGSRLSLRENEGDTVENREERERVFRGSEMGGVIRDVFGPQRRTEKPLDPPSVEVMVHIERPAKRGVRSYFHVVKIDNPGEGAISELERLFLDELPKNIPKTVWPLLTDLRKHLV